jgi:cobalt-zinc-cadmium efflux system membrane fusion protein
MTLYRLLHAALLLGGTLACSRPLEAPAARPYSPRNPGPSVTLTNAKEELIADNLQTHARIVFDEDHVAHVFSPVTGRVRAIYAQLGQSVKKGDPLAVLSSPDLGTAASEAAKATSNLMLARHELARQKDLYAEQAAPRRDLETAQCNFEQAKAEATRTRDKMTLLGAHHAADTKEHHFTLTAPIDGNIVARQINPGAEVVGQYSGGATQELFTVGSQEAVWAISDIYEQDVGRIELGATVEVRSLAFPDSPLPGKIDWIADSLDPVLRTLSVRSTLANPSHQLKAQMFATMIIHAKPRRALAVPRRALLRFGHNILVMGVNASNSAFVRRPVEVDDAGNGLYVPVLRGLHVGDPYVSEGALLVSEAIR